MIVDFFELEIQDCYILKKKKEKIATYQLWLQKEIYMIVDFITVSIKLQAPIYVGIVQIEKYFQTPLGKRMHFRQEFSPKGLKKQVHK